MAFLHGVTDRSYSIIASRATSMPDASGWRTSWRLTFDMSGSQRQAKFAAGCPLDGGYGNWMDAAAGSKRTLLEDVRSMKGLGVATPKLRLPSSGSEQPVTKLAVEQLMAGGECE
jgi:hypothetical protein